MTSYVWFVRGEQHAAMCRTSIESVRKTDPEAKCFVMTDDPLRLSEESRLPMKADAVFHIETGRPIMVANLEAQIEGMFRTRDPSTVFLDTDILLLKKLPHVGNITVTWRDHVTVGEDGEKQEGIASIMPYNYGVITAQYGRGAVEAFIWMRERVKQMGDRQQEWYGNQLALAELAGPLPKEPVGTDIREREIPWSLHQQGTRIAVGRIPCADYNYTPQRIDECTDLKYALHFKGKKRELMKPYAERLGLGWYL